MTPAEMLTEISTFLTDLGATPYLLGGMLVGLVAVGISRLIAATR